MTNIFQLTDTLWMIEVPMDAKGIHIDKQNMLWNWTPNKDYPNEEDADDANCIKLPQGEWQLIGEVTKDEVTFDCKPYVEYVNNPDNNGVIPYKNYSHIFLGLPSKEDSFRSLIESKSGKTFVNPLGEKPTKDLYSERLANLEGDFLGTYQYDLKAWQQAESNLIHKAIILKQII